MKWSDGFLECDSLPFDTCEERVTICINTKDRVEYLLVTLSSLLSQSYQHWDLILMDASSNPAINDERVARLLSVIKKYRHDVRYETDSSMGIAQSYETMTQMSKTEFVVRQEDDIWMEPEMIQKAMEAIVATDCGAIGFMTPHWECKVLTAAPKILRNGFLKTRSALCPNLPHILEPHDQQCMVVKEDVFWPVCTIHGGSVFRKDMWEEVGFAVDFSPTGHREETMFYSKAYAHGWDLGVRSTSRLWHFESSIGGSRPRGAKDDIRNNHRSADEIKFQAAIELLIAKHPERPVYFLD